MYKKLQTSMNTYPSNYLSWYHTKKNDLLWYIFAYHHSSPLKWLNSSKTCLFSKSALKLQSTVFVMLKMSKYCDCWYCQSREETFEYSSNQKSQTKAIWFLLEVFDWKKNNLFLFDVSDWKNKIICFCSMYLIGRTKSSGFFGGFWFEEHLSNITSLASNNWNNNIHFFWN